MSASESDSSLFSGGLPRAGASALPTGILPVQAIREMLRNHEIQAMREVEADQLQPASLDLRLGKTAWRVRASFLPGPRATVMQRVEQLDGYPIDLSGGAVLERGCVYVVQLQESLTLKSGIAGFANPKSTTGRLDILTRLITDHSGHFDVVPLVYSGPLFAEITPRTFSVVVREGQRLNQLRFRRGYPVMGQEKLQQLHAAGKLVVDGGEPALREKLVPVTIDLEGQNRGALIGFRAKKHTDRIDLGRIGHYDPLDFWEPLYRHREPTLVLDPDDFYILATRESVRIPPDLAAEMVAYDTAVGEFRVHYAGFFDPGFGWDAESRAVLEVRSHEVPFVLEHGQTIGWLHYERMAHEPERLYGTGMKSNYQGQGLMLAKQFRPLAPPG
ncbi:MAG TPA: 2'-deoxycytidine 5'-triphosphate deaminase [Kiloniellales bacterium]|nr:2'-deoxycytidine 5'-triphosphate deaminase [Kiloniellales bacterium]